MRPTVVLGAGVLLLWLLATGRALRVWDALTKEAGGGSSASAKPAPASSATQQAQCPPGYVYEPALGRCLSPAELRQTILGG